jgi:putative peptide zinc metalloprotease protein
MLRSFFSPSWYRVASLRPRLRRHAQIHRHHYRGELWYVLQDLASGRLYRFSPVAYQVIGLMDGRLTVQELWDKALERFGDDAPTQGEMVNLLSQLHSSDVLLCDVAPDTAELFRRHTKQERSWWKTNLRSPLSLRFPLFKPEKFLARTAFLVRPLFSVYGALLWLVVVGAALVLAGLHWQDLTEDVMDRVLSGNNLLLLWLVFPLIKALHELGHGYAIKILGGQVPEMGIMLLVMMPVPYVDASSSSAFREQWRRVLVGAAGMLVELFIGSLALFVWLGLWESASTLTLWPLRKPRLTRSQSSRVASKVTKAVEAARNPSSSRAAAAKSRAVVKRRRI